ncbi:halovibrin HvnC [Pseudomonas sp. AF32]|uniref:halovibrin HvnC n=1 Tax=Pseudomonas sp. AF32 TaxID=554390 RepID=UPI001EEEF6A7|nr:halovibrin HvnC [Pseudomonas sp. AF32]
MTCWLFMGKALRRLILGSAGPLLIGLMGSCTQLATEPPEIMHINGTEILDGPGTAAYLTTLYNRKFPNCNRVDSQPAFLCSGITHRLTVKDPANLYKVWDPSPISESNGGVSFSYMRADTNFSAFGGNYQNGYIIYPFLEAPAGKIQLFYMCSYPMDGWTQSRIQVCGPHADYPHHSHLCQYHNVTIAEQWVYVWTYPNPSAELHRQQCGFDVSDDRNTLAAPAFHESLRARALLAAVHPSYAAQVFREHNEIIIKTWARGQPNNLPILAFFYVAGYPLGLAEAQYNQRDFYDSTNPKILLPIIRLTPAASLSQSASFAYVTTDQAVRP